MPLPLMKPLDHKAQAALPYCLAGVASGLAFWVWGSSLGWDFSHLSVYVLFPLLGLLAFSIMWSHYMVGALKNNLLRGTDLTHFFRYSEYVVLAAILLHP